jgi:hypothetical protein
VFGERFLDGMLSCANNRHFGEGVGGDERFEGPEDPIQNGGYVDEEFLVLMEYFSKD